MQKENGQVPIQVYDLVAFFIGLSHADEEPTLGMFGSIAHSVQDPS